MNDDLSELIGKLVGYTIGVLVANGIIMWVYNMVIPDVFGLKPIGSVSYTHLTLPTKRIV